MVVTFPQEGSSICIASSTENSGHGFVEWEDLLKIDELNADNSTKMYLDKINMLLDTYAPLKLLPYSLDQRLIVGFHLRFDPSAKASTWC